MKEIGGVITMTESTEKEKQEKIKKKQKQLEEAKRLRKEMGFFRYRKAYIDYTWQHKKAFLQVEKKILGKNTISGYLHDLDKIFLYMIPFLNPQTTTQKIHKLYSKHHLDNRFKKSPKNYIETLIDWECARITKPDKPLNCYDTLVKYYPQYADTMLPFIQKFLPEQIPAKEVAKSQETVKNILSDKPNYTAKTKEKADQNKTQSIGVPQKIDHQFVNKSNMQNVQHTKAG